MLTLKLFVHPHAITNQLKLVGFKQTAALFSSESNEWYTPPHLIAKVREVLGTIDLDPASCATAQEWIKASRFYTAEDDGFSQPWEGRIFLNPPYGHRNMKKLPTVLGASAWLEKLVKEYESGNVSEAIALCRGDSKGLKMLEAIATKGVLPNRIRFYRANGESKQSIPGAAFYYLGVDDSKLKHVFGAIGECFQPSKKKAS